MGTRDRQDHDVSDDLGEVRRAFAEQVMAAARVEDMRLEAAFAAVRREDFLGPGPWSVLDLRDGGYRPTQHADPVALYADILVGILPDRHLNNGQPSLHANLLAQTAPRPGEHVVHVGAGTGYYTAIIAELVGASGRVTAIELDAGLATRAAANLAPWPQVRVLAGDGMTALFDPADVIYANAGATQPANSWLDGLRDGGRLVLPLTTDKGFLGGEAVRIERRGAVFLVTRRGAAYEARWISPVAIFPCGGGREPASEWALAAALADGGWEHVTRLYREERLPDERCWLRGADWCLAYS